MTTLSAIYAQDASFRADAAGFSAKTPCFVAALAARTMFSAPFSADADVHVIATADDLASNGGRLIYKIIKTDHWKD